LRNENISSEEKLFNLVKRFLPDNNR